MTDRNTSSPFSKVFKAGTAEKTGNDQVKDNGSTASGDEREEKPEARTAADTEEAPEETAAGTEDAGQDGGNEGGTETGFASKEEGTEDGSEEKDASPIGKAAPFAACGAVIAGAAGIFLKKRRFS